MTYEFKYLMRLLGCALEKKEIPAPEQAVDWEKLIKMASSQGIFPVFAYTVGRCEDGFVPEPLRNRMKELSQQYIIMELSRKMNTLYLLGKLERQGVQAVVVKGFAVSDCYAMPETRISGDVDILIDKKQERKTLHILGDCCQNIKKRKKGDHHSVCYHQSIGIIEVHVLLYDEFVEDIWFKEMKEAALIREPYERVDCEGGSYYTLGKTDHMIFLALHMVKHFILSGINLRQMLMSRCFAKIRKIDAGRFFGVLRALQYETFICNVIGAAAIYCGLPAAWLDLLPVRPEEEAIDMIMDDLESVCYLSDEDRQSRFDGWHAYTKARSEKFKSSRWYRFYMKRRAILPALFPPREHMIKTYPVLDKCPFFMPLLWLHRLFIRGGRRILFNDIPANIVENENDISQAGQRRMDMFRNLDMI